MVYIVYGGVIALLYFGYLLNKEKDEVGKIWLRRAIICAFIPIIGGLILPIYPLIIIMALPALGCIWKFDEYKRNKPKKVTSKERRRRVRSI